MNIHGHFKNIYFEKKVECSQIFKFLNFKMICSQKSLGWPNSIHAKIVFELVGFKKSISFRKLKIDFEIF